MASIATKRGDCGETSLIGSVHASKPARPGWARGRAEHIRGFAAHRLLLKMNAQMPGVAFAVYRATPRRTRSVREWPDQKFSGNARTSRFDMPCGCLPSVFKNRTLDGLEKGTVATKDAVSL